MTKVLVIGDKGAAFTTQLPLNTVTLTDGATIPLDASLGNVHYVVLGGNRTISNPVNPLPGQELYIVISQDGTGSRTASWGTAYDFGTTGTPTLSTGANKVDIVKFLYVDGTLNKWCFVGFWAGN